MFDRIFDFLEKVWEWLIPWVVIDAYEEGIILQLGIFRRVIKPGLRFMLPFGIDNCKYETVVRQTSDLTIQSVTSKDDKSVSLKGILTYRITDIKKFLLMIDEGETDVQNMCYGVITNIVEKTNWDNIRTEKFNKKAFNKCSKLCDEFCGVELLDVTFSDKTVARQLRLLQ